MQVTLNNQEITFQVLYAKRKKYHMTITPEGHITVKAPSDATEDAIYTFVKSQSSKIFQVYDRLANRKVVSSEKTYTQDEEYFLYLGKAYTLYDLIEIHPDSAEIGQLLLKKFYTKKTKEIVKKRVKHFEKIIGVQAKSITVVDSPRTWGTCNGAKNLTFNYKLSMAPESVIDYVVIHELCHILHLNHDRSFWRKVGMYDPHYKVHQDYLSRFGGVMTV